MHDDAPRPAGQQGDPFGGRYQQRGIGPIPDAEGLKQIPKGTAARGEQLLLGDAFGEVQRRRKAHLSTRSQQRSAEPGGDGIGGVRRKACRTADRQQAMDVSQGCPEGVLSGSRRQPERLSKHPQPRPAGWVARGRHGRRDLAHGGDAGGSGFPQPGGNRRVDPLRSAFGHRPPPPNRDHAADPLG
jgi:hypothetical protein